MAGSPPNAVRNKAVTISQTLACDFPGCQHQLTVGGNDIPSRLVTVYQKIENTGWQASADYDIHICGGHTWYEYFTEKERVKEAEQFAQEVKDYYGRLKI